MKKIGVFDSGIGGVSVLNYLRENLPDNQYLFKDDKINAPYGDKPLDEIRNHSLDILRQLEAEGCDVIVVACNTITTNFISLFREIIKVPLIGIEPMVKPASLATKTKVIAVCATPRTLESRRYQKLKDEFAIDVTVIEPDCSNWAYMIENNEVNVDQVKTLINSLLAQNVDQIVLGCTHYHWIEDLIKKLVPENVGVLQPEEAILGRLKEVLKQLD